MKRNTEYILCAGKAHVFAQFVPKATQDVVTIADPILQEDTEVQRDKMTSQGHVASGRALAHSMRPSARNTAPHNPDAAQMLPLQGDFPGPRWMLSVPLTALGTL